MPRHCSTPDRNDTKGVLRLLKRGIRIDIANDAGKTALAEAIMDHLDLRNTSGLVGFTANLLSPRQRTRVSGRNAGDLPLASALAQIDALDPVPV